MKIKINLPAAATGFLLGSVLLAGFVSAEENAKGRDVAVDAVLAGKNFAGVLPATAGPAVSSGIIGNGQQPFLDPARPDKFPDPSVMTSDKSDKKGRVFEVKGNAKITKKSSNNWKPLENKTWIEEGDSILTEKGAYVSIAFDAKFLNVTHIPENTRAVFKSIEPLDLFIEDGTVFNIFDGLTPNSQWKVSTPTAVAAVRGTYFAVHFTAANGDIFTATFNVPDDGHSSIVELMDVLSGGGTGSSVDITEGQQINLKEGETLDPSLLGGISQEWIDQMMQILQRVLQQRQNQGGNGYLPPTGGEFFEPNVLDPAGSNMVGGGPDVPDLDPLDETHSAGSTTQEEPSSEGSSGSGEEPPPSFSNDY